MQTPGSPSHNFLCSAVRNILCTHFSGGSETSSPIHDNTALLQGQLHRQLVCGLKHKAQLEEHACGLSEAQRSRRGPLSLPYTYSSWICLDVPGQGRGDSSVIEMFVTKAREPAFYLQNPPICRQGGRGRCALTLLSIQFWPVRDPT